MKLFLIVTSTSLAISTYYQEVFAVGTCGANQTCVVDSVVNSTLQQSMNSVATNGTRSSSLENTLKSA